MPERAPTAVPLNLLQHWLAQAAMSTTAIHVGAVDEVAPIRCLTTFGDALAIRGYKSERNRAPNALSMIACGLIGADLLKLMIGGVPPKRFSARTLPRQN